MEGNSRGFGFVSFKSHEAAAECVEDLNGKEHGDDQLVAGRAQKKSERSAELRARFDAIRQGRSSRFQGTNLYIKNLDDDIDDERLRKEFSRFGNITSAKVMRNDKEVSRGFGFVSFSSKEAATKAVIEMNNRIISVKQLYVDFAQPKAVRQAQLATQYMRMNMNYRVPEIQEAQQTQQAVHVPGQAPLTAQMLAKAQPHEQKQMLGERLFSIIQQSHGDIAGKITSMLLEMDNADLLHMLESKESLKAKAGRVSNQATQTAEISLTPVELTAQITALRLEMQDLLDATESLKDKVNAVLSVLADR